MMIPLIRDRYKALPDLDQVGCDVPEYPGIVDGKSGMFMNTVLDTYVGIGSCLPHTLPSLLRHDVFSLNDDLEEV